VGYLCPSMHRRKHRHRFLYATSVKGYARGGAVGSLCEQEVEHCRSTFAGPTGVRTRGSIVCGRQPMSSTVGAYQSNLCVSICHRTQRVTHPGSWLHGKYVARAHAIAWSLRQMGQSDLAWDFVPYFMNARIQPVETWKEYVTQSPSCALLPVIIVGICAVVGLCLMIAALGPPPKRI
jgi:hypothetical protein